MKKISSRAQNIIAIVLAIVIICSAIGFTLYTTVVLMGSDDGSGVGRNNITFTDAVMVCHKDTRDRYGAKIRNLVTDNHSSRYDEDSSLYKIFLKLDIYNGEEPGASLNYVNCFVRAKNGNIKKYEVLASDKGKPGGGAADDTNMFGVPRR